MSRVISRWVLGFIASLIAVGAHADGNWRRADISGIHYAVERSSLHPERWQYELQHTDDCQNSCIVAFDDRMSAIHLRYKWAQLNPQKGVYDFSDLGSVLDRIRATGKLATLVIMAGKYTPSWVFDEGAGHITTRARTTGKFSQPFVPRPWDPIFMTEYGNMMTALATFLRDDPERYETVAMVKNGAVVVNSGETRLLPVKAFDVAEDTGDKDRKAWIRGVLCKDWARAGYSEERIRAVVRSTNALIARAFPDQYLGLSYVGGKRFPSVDVTGKCKPEHPNATMRQIIEDMVNTYGDRAVIINTVLTPDSGNPPVMRWVRNHGGRIGFQVERRQVGCRVERGNPCDDVLFQETLQTGVAAGALFIEVHDGNIHRQKDILRNANWQLQGR